MADELLNITMFGFPAWIIVGVMLLAILLTIAGLAYVVLTTKPEDEV